MNRGAQCAMASVVRSSDTFDRGLKTGAQISQQDYRRVPAGSRGDRPTRMGGGARLIQPRYRQPVLRPPRHRPQVSRLGGADVAAVAGPMPVVSVQPFQSDPALDAATQARG